MPQIQLPIFPDGVTHITAELAVKKEEGRVSYFNGNMPVFVHSENDIATFRMITSQFYINGNVRQSDIVRAFGVTAKSVKRAVKLYREEGPEGFYKTRKRRNGGTVLTPVVLKEAQNYLDEGLSTSETAKKVDVKNDTLRKAIFNGRLKKPEKNSDTLLVSPSKNASTTNRSERNNEDNESKLGVGATNILERVAASMGGIITGVSIKFQAALDVNNAGVLLSLPSLLANGLLHHTKKHFSWPKGYYRFDSIFILLSFMALCRLKTIDHLRYKAPGEWGKLLGLDRIPEVKTLRQKISHLSDKGHPYEWSAELCKDWMAAAPEEAMALYVDGHVRVYHGRKTKLPRHYVARQKLCLRATVDYWVNAMDGKPFFVVNQAVDPGLIQTLEEDIIPRLIKEVPHQPNEDALEEDPLLHRFIVVFDREGYSPALFSRLKKQRIACLTYHKFPKDDWAPEEFKSESVTLISGETVKMKLAERGVCLSNGLWVREIRKLTDSGHQTSILTTDYRTERCRLAAKMFARWSQENYFKYMRKHFGLDRLISYSTEDISGTTKLVNPAYRELDGKIRRKAAILSRKSAQFGALILSGEIKPNNVKNYEKKKIVLKDEIDHLQNELNTLKENRKNSDRHITVSQLPESERFKRLSTDSKHLIDTIKMLAYRSETAMAHLVKNKMSHPDEARSLLRGIYCTVADIIPDEKKGTLTIFLHRQANHSNDEAIQQLCHELNATQTEFPGTSMRLIYNLGSSEFPRGQKI